MSIVNAALYPLSDPDRRSAIVERATRQLGEDGAAAFPDFIAPEALALMVAEATSKFPLAYRGPADQHQRYLHGCWRSAGLAFRRQ